MIKETKVKTESEALIYYPQFFSKSYFEQLAQQVEWRQNKITVFGKEHNEPRLTAWYGNPYSYSNIHWPAQTLLPVLHQIQNEIEQEVAFEFNSVLCNYYRHGQDSMGWHSDNEKMVKQTLIASASFGGARLFKVRHKTSGAKANVLLEDNSLLLMQNFQLHWQHALPKSSKYNEPRINLTFRNIVQQV